MLKNLQVPYILLFTESSQDRLTDCGHSRWAVWTAHGTCPCQRCPNWTPAHHPAPPITSPTSASGNRIVPGALTKISWFLWLAFSHLTLSTASPASSVWDGSRTFPHSLPPLLLSQTETWSPISLPALPPSLFFFSPSCPKRLVGFKFPNQGVNQAPSSESTEPSPKEEFPATLVFRWSGSYL